MIRSTIVTISILMVFVLSGIVGMYFLTNSSVSHAASHNPIVVRHDCTVIADSRLVHCSVACPPKFVASSGGWNIADEGPFGFQVTKSRDELNTSTKVDSWALTVQAQDKAETLILTVYAECLG